MIMQKEKLMQPSLWTEPKIPFEWRVYIGYALILVYCYITAPNKIELIIGGSLGILIIYLAARAEELRVKSSSPASSPDRSRSV